jgi:hypothetical protein
MVAHLSQPGILARCLATGRSISYRLAAGSKLGPAVARLRDHFDNEAGPLDLRRLGL